jgi:hypothetical protein
MPANRRERDDLPRKPKRTRPWPDAPEADEVYDEYCTRCAAETDHELGHCVPCSSPTVTPKAGPKATPAAGPVEGPE